VVSTRARSRSLLAWPLWLATFGCCAAGLVVPLVVTRPLTRAVLVEGALFALAFPLGYATVGLVLALRRSGNPIGWLYAASGLVWSLLIPLDPWVDQLIRNRRPLPLAAQLAAVAGEFYWAPAITLGITLPFLLLPDGRLRSRRWRVVAGAAVTGAVLVTVAGALTPGRTAETPLPITNPFGLAWTAGTIATAVAYLGVALNTISHPAALVSLLLRFRGSRGSSTSSCAGSPPAPPAPWPGCCWERR
jgi:two-component system, NarL family, sensor kinase